MSDVYKLRSFEALICCKAAISNWKQLQHKRNVGDVIEFFLNFLALGKSAKTLICLSCCYLPGRCVFVGNLIRNFSLYLRVIIFMKKLRASDWLKTSAFFM